MEVIEKFIYETQSEFLFSAYFKKFSLSFLWRSFTSTDFVKTFQGTHFNSEYLSFGSGHPAFPCLQSNKFWTKLSYPYLHRLKYHRGLKFQLLLRMGCWLYHNYLILQQSLQCMDCTFSKRQFFLFVSRTALYVSYMYLFVFFDLN